MLDWSSRHHCTAIRLYAAKVTAELAKNLRVGTVPGTLQLVSTLLDADGKPKRGHPLLEFCIGYWRTGQFPRSSH
jgi:hypothetical protein